MPPSTQPRKVMAIVESSVRRWTVDRKHRAKERPGAAGQPWPMITVSREFGSLGAELARRTAGRLGFDFWNQELVAAVAERTGARKALVASLDERDRGLLDEFVAGLFTGNEGTTAEYVRQLGLVIHTLQRHGGAVIVGRGAQFIVAPMGALRVRVVAPEEQRVAGYAERQRISVAEARKEVRRVDRERKAFYKKHWGKDVADPVYYDLIVNTGTLPLKAVRDTVLAAYLAKFGRLPRRA